MPWYKTLRDTREIHLPKLKSAVERTGASYPKNSLRSKDFSFGTLSQSHFGICQNKIDSELHNLPGLLTDYRTNADYRLVMTTGYGVRATKTGGPNAVKRFCSNAVLLRKMVKTRVNSLHGVEGRNALDQKAFCEFHSFQWKSKRMLALYIHATHA